jgi:hypothetical protein
MAISEQDAREAEQRMIALRREGFAIAGRYDALAVRIVVDPYSAQSVG